MYLVTVKSTVEILQHFVVFSEYMNFFSKMQKKLKVKIELTEKINFGEFWKFEWEGDINLNSYFVATLIKVSHS